MTVRPKGAMPEVTVRVLAVSGGNCSGGGYGDVGAGVLRSACADELWNTLIFWVSLIKTVKPLRRGKSERVLAVFQLCFGFCFSVSAVIVFAPGLWLVGARLVRIRLVECV